MVDDRLLLGGQRLIELLQRRPGLLNGLQPGGEKLLAPGFRVEDLTRLLRKYPQQVLMLVGHEPDFTLVIGALTGANLKLSKGGIALVDLNLRKGKLLWLFPPKIAKQ